MNLLEQLQLQSRVALDTALIEEIHKYCPSDATTNPSLILMAAKHSVHRPLLEDAATFGKKKSSRFPEQQIWSLRKLFVNFGIEILKRISGTISTQIDPRLSFDSKESIKEAKKIIQLYKSAGVDCKRVRIKIAATWQGICAAEELEKEGISCNMTLLFHPTQAIACGERGLSMIAPYVGRVSDWHKKKEEIPFCSKNDPGVLLVKNIHHSFQKMGFSTKIMAASFRSIEQILELVGCDFLTISPKFYPDLIKEKSLSHDKAFEKNHLEIESASFTPPRKTLEKEFHWKLCEDEMVTEKLSEGIRLFTRDILQLETLF